MELALWRRRPPPGHLGPYEMGEDCEPLGSAWPPAWEASLSSLGQWKMGSCRNAGGFGLD